MKRDKADKQIYKYRNTFITITIAVLNYLNIQ